MGIYCYVSFARGCIFKRLQRLQLHFTRTVRGGIRNPKNIPRNRPQKPFQVKRQKTHKKQIPNLTSKKSHQKHFDLMIPSIFWLENIKLYSLQLRHTNALLGFLVEMEKHDSSCEEASSRSRLPHQKEVLYSIRVCRPKFKAGPISLKTFDFRWF